MMLKTNSLGIAIWSVLLSAAPVGAQVSAPRESAKVELGPLALYPTVQLLNAGVDDNVFNDGNAPQRDNTLTVESRVLAVLRLGSNELLFRVGSNYVWFQEFSSERSNNPGYALRFNLSASRFKPFIGAEYNRTSERRGPAAPNALRSPGLDSISLRARPWSRRFGSTRRTTTMERHSGVSRSMRSSTDPDAEPTRACATPSRR